MIYIIILIIIILGALFVIYQLSNIKELNEITDKAINEIKELLDDKQKQIEEMLKTVKNKKINKLQKIEENMNIFDIEEILFNYRWELNKISTDDYLESDELNKIIKKINLDDESIDGLKDFYNTKTEQYNSLYKKYKIIFKIAKYNEKELFKIRKIDTYEILKN